VYYDKLIDGFSDIVEKMDEKDKEIKRIYYNVEGFEENEIEEEINYIVEI
jgi:hypothetical protein